MADETTTSETAAAAAETATAATAATGAEATQAAETTATAAQPPAWSDLIKGIADEDARKFAERFTDLGALAKGGLDLRKASSQREGWVKLPGDKATDEEKAAWRKAVGLPEGPEGYGLALDKAEAEADPEAADRFGRLLKVAFDNGAPKGAMAAIVEWYNSEKGAIATRELEAFEKSKVDGEQEMRREWGADYPARIERAALAAQHFGGQEMVALLEEKGLANHPAVLRAWAKVAAETSESVPSLAQPRQQSVSDLEALQAEARKRMDEGTYNDPAFQRRFSEAFHKAA